MTLERSGTGTAEFRPGRGNPIGRDPYGIANQVQQARLQRPIGEPDIEFFHTGKDDELGWRIRIYDLRGGLGKTRGPFVENHARSRASTLDTRFEQHLILPQKTYSVSDSASQNAGRSMYLSWANIYGSLAIGTGNVANASMWRENADGTLTPLTYSPTSQITAMVPLVIGGNNSQRLAVFRTSHAAQLLTNLNNTPSIHGTLMDAWTVAVTAAIQGFTEANLIQLLSNSVRTLRSDGAVNASPVPAYDDIPDGGFGIGLQAIAGSPIFAWWVWPEDYGAGISFVNTRTGSGKRGHITRTNLRGGDPQRLAMPLPFVRWAVSYRDGFAYSDRKQLYIHNGREIRNTRWDADRVPDSNYDRVAVDAWVNGPELCVEVNAVRRPGLEFENFPGSRWVESYDFELDAWHQISASMPFSGTEFPIYPQSLPGHGGLPLSLATGYAHSLARGSWYRLYLPPYGTNPYNTRYTQGAFAGTGREFEASGKWESPSWILPGPASRYPNSVKRIIFGGRIESEGGKVRVDAGGVHHEFINGYGKGHQVKDFADNDYEFSDLEVSITLTQGTNTRTTPQALPIVIEGVTYTGKTNSLKVPF